ncbi:GH39 family glycosyl hydrolase [Sphingomonas sp. 35-24ZXX]|uniref:GH39 family glycosyl hydrolase n=1 Tax=Sphingomonas sp. 35-24ZXX TaxID=1545915 RepID=UPI000B333346|nr:cellulase family glycosylhydrolase [Sphingomonas sp. 35-24ZXX]
MDRREFVRASSALAAAATFPHAAWAAQQTERLPVTIHAREVVGTLAHVWEESAGSDRAAITLRERWRQDLDRWVKEVGLKRVRFHGILNDELGVYAPSILNRRKVTPNFQNVFEVYDGLIERGVSPYVEVSFMPQALASGTGTFGFYKGNISPPKSLDDWSAFIRTWVGALADRYGVAALRTWPFEIWNEPNLPFFWSGNQQQYFDLYKATAVAIKQIDAVIPVGGPSTSEGAWVREFADFCGQNNAPLDFFGTHAYAASAQKKDEDVNEAVPDTVREVRRIIEATAHAGKPLWLSEWSSDSPAMIAHVVKECLPHVQAMSHWTLSGTYEELGVFDTVLREGDNGWPALYRGIARPGFNTYKLLHALGTEQLHVDGPGLATRMPGRGVAALVWNLAKAQQAAGLPSATTERKVEGSPKTLDVRFDGTKPGAKAVVRFVDQERGSPLPAWRMMGSPQYLRPEHLTRLRAASEIAPPVRMRLDGRSTLSLDLPPEGVALIEIV